MAIEIITRILCDGHLNGADTKVDAETIPPVTLPNGKQKVLDLCGECQQSISYSLLIDLAIQYGREPEGELKVRRPEPEAQFACDYCTKSFGTERGLNQHMGMMHADALEGDDDEEEDTSPAVTDEEAGDIYACPDCERTFTTPAGLGRHRTSKHAPVNA